MHNNHLPNEILSEIFDRVHYTYPKQLLEIAHTCHKWRSNAIPFLYSHLTLMFTDKLEPWLAQFDFGSCHHEARLRLGFDDDGRTRAAARTRDIAAVIHNVKYLTIVNGRFGNDEYPPHVIKLYNLLKQGVEVAPALNKVKVYDFTRLAGPDVGKKPAMLAQKLAGKLNKQCPVVECLEGKYAFENFVKNYGGQNSNSKFGVSVNVNFIIGQPNIRLNNVGPLPDNTTRAKVEFEFICMQEIMPIDMPKVVLSNCKKLKELHLVGWCHIPLYGFLPPSVEVLVLDVVDQIAPADHVKYDDLSIADYKFVKILFFSMDETLFMEKWRFSNLECFILGTRIDKERDVQSIQEVMRPIRKALSISSNLKHLIVTDLITLTDWSWIQSNTLQVLQLDESRGYETLAQPAVEEISGFFMNHRKSLKQVNVNYAQSLILSYMGSLREFIYMVWGCCSCDVILSFNLQFPLKPGVVPGEGYGEFPVGCDLEGLGLEIKYD